jgi:hypothetical protein
VHTRLGSLTHIFLALAIALSALAVFPASRGSAQDVKRPVMAYYYGWYTQNNWHSMRDYPVEQYDSRDDAVMRRQIEQARSVGIDAFICTWEYNCERLLQLAEEMGGFSIAFSVDPLAEHKLDTWDKLVNGMNHMKELSNSPAYLRWDGKPVFVFWDSWILPGPSRVSDFQNLRNQIDPNRHQFWLGGGTDFSYLDVFDAIHYFDISWESSQGAGMASYSSRLNSYNSSRGTSKPFVATVMPGYDDLLFRGGHQRSRDNGNYYRATWDDAFRYNTQAVVITSWNEWFEGSQIEPSQTYGDLFLDLTRQRTAMYRTRAGNFPDPNFGSTWMREDRPVAEGRINRTWTWGYVRRSAVRELYDGRQRQVIYLDKARMEINDSQGDRSSIWFVTNGLLARELITGRVQTGESLYEQRSPAQVNVAGDGNDLSGPTYATFSGLLDESPLPGGSTITQRIDRNGKLPSDDGLARHGVTAEYHVPQTNHAVASVFWSFMNSHGQVYDGGWRNDRLFANPFYAMGYPITEAYWTHVRVGGEPKDVLVQCFERRCLTYTPGNPDGWKVEMANVGQHYHRWRYGWSW